MHEVIENSRRRDHLAAMKRHGVTESPAGKWTRPEDYLSAFAHKRTFRRGRRLKDRTEPESPRLLLSTVPFFLLIGFLAVLAVAIMITAFPGNQPREKASPVAQKEQGVAAKGWFQEAQREFH
jgi:hypothetical protein